MARSTPTRKNSVASSTDSSTDTVTGRNNGVSLLNFGGLAIRNDVAVAAAAMGHSVNWSTHATAASTPKSDRFVQGAPVHDPFDKTPVRRAPVSLPATPKSVFTREKDVAMAGDWRSRNSSSEGSLPDTPLKNKKQVKTPRVLRIVAGKSSSSKDSTPKKSPPAATPSKFIVNGRVFEKEDPDFLQELFSKYNKLKPENAQAMYSPRYCIFVANLAATATDQELQVAVTMIFRQFGTVYVKIRRDGKQMPFAFCQYTNLEDAELAIINGRGTIILGRPCRCEKAKAHRLFHFERLYGPPITLDEVRELLEPFGRLEMLYALGPYELSQYNLGEGIVVSFEMYDQGQAALAAFRRSGDYKMTSLNHLANRSPSRNPALASSEANGEYLTQYEIDKRSIFVGNLPSGFSQEDVLQQFCGFGKIRDITVRENTSKFDASGTFCFAFVEFSSAMEVVNALEAPEIVVGDKLLRVQQKDSNGTLDKLRHRPRPGVSRFELAKNPYTTPSRPNSHRLSEHFNTPATTPGLSNQMTPSSLTFPQAPFTPAATTSSYPGSNVANNSFSNIMASDTPGQEYPASLGLHPTNGTAPFQWPQPAPAYAYNHGFPGYGSYGAPAYGNPAPGGWYLDSWGNWFQPTAHGPVYSQPHPVSAYAHAQHMAAIGGSYDNSGGCPTVMETVAENENDSPTPLQAPAVVESS